MSASNFGLAQFVGQRRDLVQHRLELLLVVGRLHHIGGDHQQAVRRHRRLRVVALLEAAAGHRHDARVLVGQIDLIGGSGPSTGGAGGLPPGFLPVAAVLAARAASLASCSACSRAWRSFARASIVASAPAILRQPLLTPRQFLGDRHAVRDIRLIRRLGLRHQIGHFGLQLRLDLARVLIRQRAVPAGVGVDLGAVQRHRAHLQHAHLAGQQQHLHEQRLDLLAESAAGTWRSCRDRDARWRR